MTEKQKGPRKVIQNIAIALLSVSAVLLFAQTQLYSLGTSLFGGGTLSGLFESSSSSEAAAAPVSLADVAAPVQVAVTGHYGRYGQSGLSTTDSSFSTLGTLLGEALGSAVAGSSCDEQTFQDGLGAVSVYYDFLRPLPLELLAGLTGSTLKTNSQSVRSLLLSASGKSVTLYLWDGNQTYTQCSTYVTLENLQEVVGSYELGNAFFAFELGTKYTSFAPLSLFIAGDPTVPILSASTGPTDANALLTALNFNPHTNSRYTEISGTEVIMEGNSTLQIAKDGTVTYRDGGDSDLRIADRSGTPTLSEAVLGGYRLLLSLLSGQVGDAQLCLQSALQSGSSTSLQFGLLVNGLPVRFPDGAAEATMQLSGTVVSGFNLRFRQYTSTEENCLLLPLRQAAAIAKQYPDCELTACYVDAGGSTVSAQWLAD